jgi:formate hydrogenlyase subunit 6/NADH:ubiquinone oxidoreductase subunit I
LDSMLVPCIDHQRCNRCGRCVVGCPTGAVVWGDGLPVIPRPADCVYCGICEDICPTGAVSLTYEIVPEQRSTTELEES